MVGIEEKKVGIFWIYFGCRSIVHADGLFTGCKSESRTTPGTGICPEQLQGRETLAEIRIAGGRTSVAGDGGGGRERISSSVLDMLGLSCLLDIMWYRQLDL